MPRFIVAPSAQDPRFKAFAAGAWPAPRPTVPAAPVARRAR